MMNIFKWPFSKDPHVEFEQLLSPHLSHLYQLAFRLTGQRDDAEDLVQDVLLKLFPMLKELREIDYLKPWLSRILYRRFVDAYRRRLRNPMVQSDDPVSLINAHASTTPGPVDFTEQRLLQRFLRDAMAQLNDDQSELILLHEIEGYSLQEIHQLNDVPVGTLKSRLSRARNRLKDILSPMEPNELPNVLSSNRR